MLRTQSWEQLLCVLTVKRHKVNLTASTQEKGIGQHLFTEDRVWMAPWFSSR